MNRYLAGTAWRALMAPEMGAGSSASDPAANAATSSASEASGSTSADAGANAAAIAPDATSAPAADAAAKSDLAPAGESSTVATLVPTLLSEAGKPKPDAKAEGADASTDTKPAPAAETKPDAKADAPAEQPVKPDDPGKTKDADKAAIDPAKEATALAPPAVVSIADLKIPEGIELAPEQTKAFLDNLNDAKLAPKDRAQGLLDLYNSEIRRVADALTKNQIDVWNGLNTKWKDETRTAPDIGGSKLEKSLSYAKGLVEEFLGNPEHGGKPEYVADYWAQLGNNGMGNNVQHIRLLNNIARWMGIFEESRVVGQQPKPPNMPKAAGQRGWYDNSINKAG